MHPNIDYVALHGTCMHPNIDYVALHGPNSHESRYYVVQTIQVVSEDTDNGNHQKQQRKQKALKERNMSAKGEAFPYNSGLIYSSFDKEPNETIFIVLPLRGKLLFVGCFAINM